MVKKLEGLAWRMLTAEHMGCVKGCLDYLGVEVTCPWLYGGTGQAFVIVIQENVDVRAPLGWNTQMLFDLAPNLGYRVEGFGHGYSITPDAGEGLFRQKQREAWDYVRACIDRGLPCYGWELASIPAYYVINGYDPGGERADGGEDTAAGYYYSGYISGGPVPWQKLGDFDVRSVQVYSVEPCTPAPDRKVVRDALATILHGVEDPQGWTLGPSFGTGFRSGLAAYELWAEALEAGRAGRDSHTYNAQMWSECRRMAVEFLDEARRRLPGRCDAAFEQAADRYSVVRDRLLALLDLHPYREPADWGEMLASPRAAALVREAGAAEREGVASLRLILAAL